MRLTQLSELYSTARQQPLALLGRYSRFLKFATIGFIALIVSMVLLFVLVQGLNMNKSLAYAIQAIVAINLNFILNYQITWADRKPVSNRNRWFLKIWAKAVGSRALAAIANDILFTILSLSINYLISNLICVLIITALNYVIGDKFVFSVTKAHPAAPTVELTGETADS